MKFVKGKKTFWEKEKMSVSNIFPFLSTFSMASIFMVVQIQDCMVNC